MSTPWADKALARRHWKDAEMLSDALLDELLAASMEGCEPYARPLRREATADTTSASAVLTPTGLTDFSEADVGAAVVGAGIPANATILSVSVTPTGTTATLSAPTTATGTDVPLFVTRPVPTSYRLAVVYQAREIRAAGMRDASDVIGVGEFAIRARPLTAQVKQLLRPKRARWTVG